MMRVVVAWLGAAMLATPPAAGQSARDADRSSSPRPPTREQVRGERPVPFKIGETLTYDVSWSTLLTAGTVVATVKEKKPSLNSTAYYMVAEARPAPLVAKLYSMYYKLDTLIDAVTLLPQRASMYSEEGNAHRFGVTTFDRAARKAQFEYRTATTLKTSYAVPASVQDPLSAIYMLRATPLKAGDHITMPVSDSGANFTLQLEVTMPERVKVPFGEISAWKVRPTIYDDAHHAVGANITLWLSDDARRLPVKLEGDLPIGSFALALRDAR